METMRLAKVKSKQSNKLFDKLKWNEVRTVEGEAFGYTFTIELLLGPVTG